MGPLLARALERAGLADVAARALLGEGLAGADLERLRSVDLLLVGGLADAVRAKHRGTPVTIGSLSPSLSVPDATGAEVLREIALARLSTRGEIGVSVSAAALGVQLAMVALAYGADELVVATPSLSHPDPISLVRRMIEESGRTVILVERAAERHEARP